jgi:hypothetical protein
VFLVELNFFNATDPSSVANNRASIWLIGVKIIWGQVHLQEQSQLPNLSHGDQGVLVIRRKQERMHLLQSGICTMPEWADIKLLGMTHNPFFTAASDS